MVDVQAVANTEEGIEFEEDDDVAGGGDIDAELLRVTAAPTEPTAATPGSSCGKRGTAISSPGWWKRCRWTTG